MLLFWLKGLVRDRHRSLFPVMVVSTGVMLTVLVHCWITGILGDVVEYSARFSTGHIRIMSRAYAENENQLPNDLAILEADRLMAYLAKAHPDMSWNRRIRFGGLIDVPDAQGDTRAQGMTAGLAVDLLGRGSTELERLNIRKALVKGRLPERSREILVSDDMSRKLGISPGDEVTFIGATMYGSLTMMNFTLAGTLRFGITAMDRGTMIVDIRDAEAALDMMDAAGEIFGYFDKGHYDGVAAGLNAAAFNARYKDDPDPYAPVMFTLEEQNNMADMMRYVAAMVGLVLFIFVFAMSVVLWNSGLLNGIRRYGEIGIRLAIGENNAAVYISMVAEYAVIGLAGSVAGTLIGLVIAWILQTKGIDIGDLMKGSAMMMPSVFRARISTGAVFIGFLPGLFSTVLGALLSGIGIFKRSTAQLFKELEV
jgi:putative ABC transport system permease protein